MIDTQLKNAYYYLLLNKNGHNDVAFYRVDRIENVSIREENREDIINILGKSYEIEISNIIKRRLYNYDGIIVLDAKDDCLTLAVNTTKSEGLYYWLMQHMDTVVVVKPNDIREELIMRIEKIIENYKK